MKKQPTNKPYDDHFNENVTDWQPPFDLEFNPIKPMYSPIGTPPRLRTYVMFFFGFLIRRMHVFGLFEDQ